MDGTAALPRSDTALWIAADKRPGPRRAQLFLLPHAGGGAPAYRLWPGLFPLDVEVLPVLLPGRDRRFGEPAIDRMERLLDGLAPAVAATIDRPYVVFGHSMGACIAHALAGRLQAECVPPPALLVVSGRNAPSLPRATPSLHDRPDDEFMAGLRRLGGTPPEVLDNRELMDLVMPTLRADFALANTYVPAAEPLATPILAIGGVDDPETTPAGLAAWAGCTTAATRVEILPGGHFFTETARPALVRLLIDAIGGLGRAGQPTVPCGA